MKIELKNIGKKCVVKLSTVSLALMMILSTFSVPSYAVSPYFVLPQYSSSEVIGNFSGSPCYAWRTDSVPSDGMFFFAHYDSYYRLIYIGTTRSASSSTNLFGNVNGSDVKPSSSYPSNLRFGVNTVVYNNSYVYDGVTYYYKDLVDFQSVSSDYEQFVVSGSDFTSCIYNFLSYVPSSIGDGYLTNGLPIGNVIYFDIGSGVEYSIDLKSYFTSKSSWFGGSWVNDNRRYGFSDELPTTATNFSESSGSSIPWSPSGSTDLLGRSDEGSATISGTSSGRYLWIINPLYNLGYYDEPDKGSSLNGNIFYIGGISADTPYYLYSLKQSATSLGLSSDVASSVGGVGTVTTSGAINTVVNDGSGNEYTPPVGGDNSPPQEVTAAEGIKQTLDQFVNMFMNIFTAPISHIQQLISMGSEFISHLSGMWSWLPSEVSGFVTSAFVLLIVIGVIKLLI